MAAHRCPPDRFRARTVRYVTTNVRIDPAEYGALQAEAWALGISLAEALRRAVREHLTRRYGRDQEALEDSRAYEPRATGVRLALAHRRGGELVLPAPADLEEDQPVLVAISGSASVLELELIQEHTSRLDDLAAELAALPSEGV